MHNRNILDESGLTILWSQVLPAICKRVPREVPFIVAMSSSLPKWSAQVKVAISVKSPCFSQVYLAVSFPVRFLWCEKMWNTGIYFRGAEQHNYYFVTLFSDWCETERLGGKCPIEH